MNRPLQPGATFLREGDPSIPSPTSPVTEIPVATPGAPEAEAEEGRGISQASALVKFVQSAALLFHDEDGNAYARLNETKETRRLDSRAFRDWLSAQFFQGNGAAAREQSTKEALATLAGLARYGGDCREVFTRVGKHNGGDYYLDLGEPKQNRAIRIAPGRWNAVDATVQFLRPDSQRPLPLPQPGGRIGDLWQLVNIPEPSRLLVLAWLCECLRTDTPFPVVELFGEQGSAKSTTQKLLRRLIDPSACDLRAAPKTTEDIFVSAGSGWVVSYENISHLPAPMQDALCVLATGGGFAKRKLFTDADESIISVSRPVILNGISIAVTAQDLLDRTLSIELPNIADRRETSDLWRQFEREHGRLLGALLDLFAAALTRLPNIQIPRNKRPRLIEFARLGMAIAEATGRNGDEFLDQFTTSRQESIARTIDASPVATALVDWFDLRHRQGIELSLKDLLAEVELRKPSGAENWPRTPKGFGDALRRVAPALRQLGIEVRSKGKVGSTVRWAVSSTTLSGHVVEESF